MHSVNLWANSIRENECGSGCLCLVMSVCICVHIFRGDPNPNEQAIRFTRITFFFQWHFRSFSRWWKYAQSTKKCLSCQSKCEYSRKGDNTYYSFYIFFREREKLFLTAPNNSWLIVLYLFNRFSIISSLILVHHNPSDNPPSIHIAKKSSLPFASSFYGLACAFCNTNTSHTLPEIRYPKDGECLQRDIIHWISLPYLRLALRASDGARLTFRQLRSLEKLWEQKTLSFYRCLACPKTIPFFRCWLMATEWLWQFGFSTHLIMWVVVVV